MESGVYVGTLRHRRHAPRAHHFTYSTFMSLLDIDRIDELMAVSPFTSVNRFNWATFDHRDHIGDAGLPLRERLRHSAWDAGIQLAGGPIYLLTHLRYAGYVFNPISLYYCCDAAGAVRQVLADVRNTYGGRRSYWLDPQDAATHRFRAVTPKTLYVSPFMEPAVAYEFRLTPPGESVVAHMNVVRLDGERLFDATLTLERRPWSAAAIRRALCGYPLMTAKVVGAIYFEALRLRLKGLREMPAPRGRH